MYTMNIRSPSVESFRFGGEYLGATVVRELLRYEYCIINGPHKANCDRVVLLFYILNELPLHNEIGSNATNKKNTNHGRDRFVAMSMRYCENVSEMCTHN